MVFTLMVFSTVIQGNINNLLRQEVIDAENELAKAVQAKNS